MQAEGHMQQGLDETMLAQYPDTSPDEPYRRQLAYSDLPLYSALVLNRPLSRTELDENQTRIAFIADDVVTVAETYRDMGQADKAGPMDGLISELILHMGYNRSPVTGPEGVIGFAVASTYRQDATPFARKPEFRRSRSQLKGNWDVSILVRNAEQDSTIGTALGKLGQTAVQETGLHIGDNWRVAAKLQVKSKLILRQRNERSTTERQSRMDLGDQVWAADEVVGLRPLGTQSLAAEYDFQQVIPIGMAEDLGLTSPGTRIQTLRLLVAEGQGEQLSRKNTQRLRMLKRTIKNRVVAKLDTPQYDQVSMSA